MVQATPGSVRTDRERAFHRSLELDLILVEKRADVEQELVVPDACENGYRSFAQTLGQPLRAAFGAHHHNTARQLETG